MQTSRRSFFAGFAGVLAAFGIGTKAAKATISAAPETVISAEELERIRGMLNAEPQVLRLHPGDVVVFSTSEKLPQEACARFCERIKDHFPSDVKAIVICSPLRVDSILRDGFGEIPEPRAVYIREGSATPDVS